MSTPRSGHTATLLRDGKVLAAGGSDVHLGRQVRQNWSSAELYDPTPGKWTATGSMSTKRADHTATLLGDGKVLVAGGRSDTGSFDEVVTSASAEVFDPATGKWTATGSMSTERTNHTATLLPNGKVLVAGGFTTEGGPASPKGGTIGRWWSSAELYDPATGKWAATGSMSTARKGHSAILLPSGKVLVAGGDGESEFGEGYWSLSSAELFDPTTGRWTTTSGLSSARELHTATLLGDGKVLVAGGANPRDNGLWSSAEIYDPGTGKWSATGSMSTWRLNHTATLLTNGKVLVAGGQDPRANDSMPSSPRPELYDPTTGAWTFAGGKFTAVFGHTATLLPNGEVLLAGGDEGSGGPEDPVEGNTATLGTYEPGARPTATVYATATAPSGGPVSSARAASLALGRFFHTATRLTNGKVLVTGGWAMTGPSADGTASDTAELYDPAAGTWTAVDSMKSRRIAHTATLLANGKVLVVGGWLGTDLSDTLSSAELYDPASGKWTLTDSLKSVSGPEWATPWPYAATLLGNGKVLVVGGSPDPSAELYDPATGKWSATASPAQSRMGHAATLLANGKVLLMGMAVTGGNVVPSAEIYDPHTGKWAETGEPKIVTALTPILLPNGKVLVVGAMGPDFDKSGAELYDPATGKWTPAGQAKAPHPVGTATLLRDGRVLVLGGQDMGSGGRVAAAADLLDPATGTWTDAGRHTTVRYSYTATLLADGRVLVVGGGGPDPDTGSSCELVTVGP